MESELPASLRRDTLPGLHTLLNDIPSDSLLFIVSESDAIDAGQMELIPGGNGRLASKDMVQAVVHSAQRAGFSISIQSLLLSFYRLNWVDGSAAAATCLENGFQAVELVISSKTRPNQLKSYTGLLRNTVQETVLSDAMQYSIINAASQVITISEILYIQILFFILGITLLGSCLFSFMFGQRKKENRTIFLRWWYLGPLLVILTFLLTWFSQSIIITLFNGFASHPGYAFFLKAVLITVSFLLLCEVRYCIPLAQTDYLYSFFMILSSALAVFLFTSIDMPLLLPFSIMYILFLLSRPIKKWWINVCFFIVELIPLIYVFIRATPYLKQTVFVSLTNASPLIMLFTSILFLPYLLMLIRIFVSSGIWNSNKGKKRIITETSVLSGLLIIIILLATLSFQNEDITKNQDAISTQTYENQENSILIQADAQHENGMISFELVFTDNDKSILRYDVSAYSSSSVPVYSSNILFSFSDTSGEITFNLDEYPCNPFTIEGIAPDNLPLTFAVSAWYLHDSSVYKEEYSVVFAEENAGKNHTIQAIIK
ncbi:MAG: hypothetical protein KBT02_03060 [Treponema sp.]|nr:hypothetical protein [Candidatus Treponema caballi]